MAHRLPLAATVSLLALAAAPDDAGASAFQLNERSTKALGAALAGATSAATDVSFAGFNPAALATVEKSEVAASVSPIVPQAEGDVEGFGQRVHPDQAAVAPAFAGGYRLLDDVVLGLVSHAPFGLTTDYESDFVGALDAETTEFFTLQASPMASWEATGTLSFGAALNVLYSKARLSNAAVDARGDAVDVGFSAGLLFEPVRGTRLGLAYHHGYDLELEGDNEIGVLPGEPTFDSSTVAHLPNAVHVGLTQEITPDFRLMAEGRWIGWSRFDEVDIVSPEAPDLRPVGGPDFSDLTELQNYEDAFFVGIGAEYDATDRLTLRGGLAFDETPTTDAARNPRVPDEDRTWFAVGGSYAISDRFTVDAGYALLYMFEDTVVRLNSVPAEVVYEGTHLHVLSVGGVLRF
ncbi:MAG TPA: outer membrane protein transport protein [Thermohalobaculum sp.]|nr:outer membrane protein transport protein [Thermohalobaculum sp.]